MDRRNSIGNLIEQDFSICWEKLVEKAKNIKQCQCKDIYEAIRNF